MKFMGCLKTGLAPTTAAGAAGGAAAAVGDAPAVRACINSWSDGPSCCPLASASPAPVKTADIAAPGATGREVLTGVPADADATCGTALPVNAAIKSASDGPCAGCD